MNGLEARLEAELEDEAGPLRVGIIGCGRIAQHGYVPAIAGCDAVEVVALADPVGRRCEMLARACVLEPSTYTDARALIDDKLVEAVIVASPAGEHLAAVRLAAATRLPCLVEKPPTPDAASARELAALEPRPWIGFNRRFQQGLELLDQIPVRGRLELELELRYRRASWRAHTVCDNALLDLGPHLIDLALLLAGDGDVISAVTSPERAELLLELERGSARIRCATDRSHLERAVVRAGGVEVAASRGPGLAGATVARLRRGEHPLVASLRSQLEAFATAARGGDPGLLATADDGVRVMELVKAAAALEMTMAEAQAA